MIRYDILPASSWLDEIHNDLSWNQHPAFKVRTLVTLQAFRRIIFIPIFHFGESSPSAFGEVVASHVDVVRKRSWRGWIEGDEKLGVEQLADVFRMVVVKKSFDLFSSRAPIHIAAHVLGTCLDTIFVS